MALPNIEGHDEDIAPVGFLSGFRRTENSLKFIVFNIFMPGLLWVDNAFMGDCIGFCANQELPEGRGCSI